jgi:spermidine synthase
VRELARVQSEHQEILVFESASHGRVLVLDGAVQITEADEFVYQEMLAHVPLLAHGEARRVLIIGGGDGGILRRVLEHGTVERAAMVEIDGEVILLAREHMPAIAGGAWSDPRAEVIVGDGLKYLAESPDGAFDVIIVDSTDPVGVAETLFTEQFYRDCARALGRNGLVANQSGVPFMQSRELAESSRRRARVFPYATAYIAAVPTYVGGFMALGIAAKQPGLERLPPGVLRQRAQAAGILGRTRYWSPEVQAAAFQLPPYISRQLP